jgi:H+/Cl- antiporter ClcA
MQILKSVGVLSVAKIMGLIYACMGLIFAPFFLLVGMVGSLAGQYRSPFAGAFGVFFALLMPVFYGVLGFIAGAIGALLYNLFSNLVGGFELRIELRPDTPVAPYPIVPPVTPASNL